MSALKIAGEFANLVERCLNHCQETRISSSHTQILKILNFSHTTVSTLRCLTTGGMNIHDGHWFERRSAHSVRCLHFGVQGPVVAELQRTFALD